MNTANGAGHGGGLVAGPSLTLDDEGLARDYDQISARWQFVAGQVLVGDLAIKTGERVLDVGCGTGLLAQYVADITGPSGFVLGIDPLPLRIQIAAARTRPGLEFRVGDAYGLDGLCDASFDVVCLNAVFHWLPEKTGPLKAFARLLKSGGRLGISSGFGDRRSSLRDAAVRVLSQTPFKDYPVPRAAMTYEVGKQEMSKLLPAAGFAIARLEVRHSVREMACAEDAIRHAEASSFGNFLAYLPVQHRTAARDLIKRELESMAASEPLREERDRLIAIGVRQ
jgi:ubiquinone/menaquinone biosynthesis C-methylase UbiE